LLQGAGEARNKPDLVITDFAMGSVNGFEVIERCKKAHPTLKTLLVSGTVDENFSRLAPVNPIAFSPNLSSRASCWNSSKTLLAA